VVSLRTVPNSFLSGSGFVQSGPDFGRIWFSIKKTIPKSGRIGFSPNQIRTKPDQSHPYMGKTRY
jgi:hypothetical protein